MSIETGSVLDLERLVNIDDHPRCEWQGSETIHGEGEAATAVSHNPCRSCGVTCRALIGDACIQMMHRVQREIPDLTYDCRACGEQTELSLMYVTPI